MQSFHELLLALDFASKRVSFGLKRAQLRHQLLALLELVAQPLQHQVVFRAAGTLAGSRLRRAALLLQELRFGHHFELVRIKPELPANLNLLQQVRALIQKALQTRYKKEKAGESGLVVSFLFYYFFSLLIDCTFG